MEAVLLRVMFYLGGELAVIGSMFIFGTGQTTFSMICCVAKLTNSWYPLSMTWVKGKRVIPCWSTRLGRVRYSLCKQHQSSCNLGLSTASGVPTSDEFIIANTTSVVLLLEDWPNGGCPIQYYTVEITRKGQSGWRTVSRTAQPFGELELTALLPGTWYILRITVVSDSGSQQHTLSFATRAADGSK